MKVLKDTDTPYGIWIDLNQLGTPIREKIDLIKMIRDESGCTLAEAKYLCDDLVEILNKFNRNRKVTAPPSAIIDAFISSSLQTQRRVCEVLNVDYKTGETIF